MTLHAVIVEDNENFVEELRAIIAHLPGDSDVRVASSRDQALEMLDREYLDLLILDLKIPTMNGALDADPEHGHAVFARTRSIAPGTPVFVLTGSPAEDFLPDLLKEQEQVDIWSEGQKTGTIQFLKKYNVDSCPEILRPIALAIERLSDVELEVQGLNLTRAEDRLIRIFARRFRGVRCSVSELSGGLSNARVIRLRVTDDRGVVMQNAVAKLAVHDDVRREGHCYDSRVTQLAAGATPRKLVMLEYGAHKRAGIFFGLAEGSEESVFDIVGKDPARVPAVMENVETAMARWVEGVPEARMAIREVRQRVLDDETLKDVRSKFDLEELRDFEALEIQVRWGCCHGDLHGGNILVSPSATELIDYADVGDGPASLDPVTLELSLLFHPGAPKSADGWPSAGQTRAWGDLEAYLKDCPFAEFVRECRAWALRRGAGNREVAASAYSYLVKQLKYDDTNKDLAQALLDGVVRFYTTST